MTTTIVLLVLLALAGAIWYSARSAAEKRRRRGGGPRRVAADAAVGHVRQARQLVPRAALGDAVAQKHDFTGRVGQAPKQARAVLPVRPVDGLCRRLRRHGRGREAGQQKGQDEQETHDWILDFGFRNGGDASVGAQFIAPLCPGAHPNTAPCPTPYFTHHLTTPQPYCAVSQAIGTRVNTLRVYSSFSKNRPRSPPGSTSIDT